MKTVSSTVGVLLAEARKLEATCDEPTLRSELATALKVRTYIHTYEDGLAAHVIPHHTWCNID